MSLDKPKNTRGRFEYDPDIGLYLPNQRQPLEAKQKNNKDVLTRILATLSLVVAAYSAYFAYKSANQGREQFKLDERAWVEVASIVSESKDPAVHSYVLSLRNFGKTPAYNLRLLSGFYFGEEGVEPGDYLIDAALGRYLASKDPKQEPLPRRIDQDQPAPATLAPGATSAVPIQLVGFDLLFFVTFAANS